MKKSIFIVKYAFQVHSKQKHISTEKFESGVCEHPLRVCQKVVIIIFHTVIPSELITEDQPFPCKLLAEEILKILTVISKQQQTFQGSMVSCSNIYSKVPPLRNCIIRNSGLILLNKIPLYKKLPRLIHVQYLIPWYIAISFGLYLNMSPIGLNSLETRMKVSSPNCYNFNNPSVLAQAIRSLHSSAYFTKFS